MGHLVARDVEFGDRPVVGASVSVGHAEAFVEPEGVGVADAEVHAGVGAAAVVGYAVTAEPVVVEVPCLRHAVGGVHGRRLAVGRSPVAPDVVVVGDQRALSVGPGSVVRLVAAALRVGQFEVVGAPHARDLDPAVVSADPLACLDLLVAHQPGAVPGVGQDVQTTRGAVLPHTGDNVFPGQFRLTVSRPYDQPGFLLHGGLAGVLLLRGGQGRFLRLRGGEGRVGRRDGDRRLRRLGDTAGLAALVHHQVAP